MATNEPTNPQLPQTVDLSALGTVIGDAVAAGITKSGRRKVSFGEYIARGGANSFHRGNPMPSLKRNYFQNGYRMPSSTLTDKECDLLDRITHSGRYINRLVEVSVADDAEGDVNLRWKCESVDQRFELKGFVRNFEDMLQQIVDAQELEDLEEDERKKNQTSQTRRTFGSGRASSEAREKAGV